MRIQSLLQHLLMLAGALIPVAPCESAEPFINMSMKDQTFQSVLHAVARQAGTKVLLDASYAEDLQATFDMEKVPLSAALSRVCEEMNRVYHSAYLGIEDQGDYLKEVTWQFAEVGSATVVCIMFIDRERKAESEGAR